jgi:uncharacterized membrane protein SirB2
MSYTTYKILHLFAIFFVFLSLGGLTLRAMDHGDKGKSRARRLAGITHGLALILVLVSGFGLLARLGVQHDWVFPPWVWAKLIIWLLLGASVAFIRKKEWHRALWWIFPILGGAAAALALLKPGG